MKGIYLLICISIVFTVFSCENRTSLKDVADKDITENEDKEISEPDTETPDGETGDMETSDKDAPFPDTEYPDEMADYEAEDVDHISPDDDVPVSCNFNDQCPGDQYYCEKEEDDCEGEGMCVLRPTGCDDIYEPVCGCDGNTHGNKCYANAEGVNIFYPLPCIEGEETATLKYDYEWSPVNEKITGKIEFSFKTFDWTHLFEFPSQPERVNVDSTYSRITLFYGSLNGMSIHLSFLFQREPFKLPYDVVFAATGDNTAELRAQNGTVIGHLTGTAEVTRYEARITGGMNILTIEASDLGFE